MLNRPLPTEAYGWLQVFVGLPRHDARGWTGFRNVLPIDPLRVPVTGLQEVLRVDVPRVFLLIPDSEMASTPWLIEKRGENFTCLLKLDRVVLPLCGRMADLLMSEHAPVGSAYWLVPGEELTA